MYKTNLRSAHDRFSKLELDILFKAAENRLWQFQPPRTGVILPYYFITFFERLVEAGFVKLDRTGVGHSNLLDDAETMVEVTENGLDFIRSLGKPSAFEW